MKKSIFFSILLIAALGFTSCVKIDCGCDPKPNHKQPVLFQYEYYNYAWGFRHSGFLIDEYGNVNGFKQPSRWITADSTGMMTKADLEYNLDQCDTICGKVNKEVLENNFRKIEDIRYGKIDDYGMVMADAGTGVFSAWYWNERVRKYENVFLISNGDISKVNTHRSVKEIVEWLRTIGEKTNRFWWYPGN